MGKLKTTGLFLAGLMILAGLAFVFSDVNQLKGMIPQLNSQADCGTLGVFVSPDFDWLVDLDTMNLQADFNDLQTAINTAADGDRIALCPGTYVDRIILQGRSNLSIFGVDQASVVFSQLSSSAQQSTLFVTGSNEIKIANLTFRGNIVPQNEGGAMDVITSSVLLNRVVFENNVAYSGGAIHADESELTIHDSSFSLNSAEMDGGAISGIFTDLFIFDTDFSDNSVNTALTSIGGALSLSEAYHPGHDNVLHLENTHFNNNQAGISGGAVYLSWVDAEISTTHFVENEGINGGALYSEGGILNIEQSRFERNFAWDGGAILKRLDSIENGFDLDSSYFQANESTHFGGAVYFIEANNVLDSSEFKISRTHFGENNAMDVAGVAYSRGGAVNCGSSHLSLKINQSSFFLNEANSGGAIDNRCLQLLVANSTFSENIARVGDGGAIHNNSGSVHLENNSFVGNTAAFYGASFRNWADLSIKGNLFMNNVAQYFIQDVNGVSLGYNYWDTAQPELAATTTDLVGQGPVPLASPYRFKNHTTYGYLFSNNPSSPAIDAIPSNECDVHKDQRGLARPQNGACDIGAIEHQ